MTNADFKNVVKTFQVSNKTIEVKCTNSGNFWGIFENGQKITDYCINERNRVNAMNSLLTKLGVTSDFLR